jgi:hypothetical protein
MPSRTRGPASWRALGTPLVLCSTLQKGRVGGFDLVHGEVEDGVDAYNGGALRRGEHDPNAPEDIAIKGHGHCDGAHGHGDL